MKVDGDMVATLLTFIVGGGLATLVTQLVRSWSALRAGTRATTREVVKDLAAARDEAEDRLESRTADLDYWRGVAADYNYQLRQAGLVPMPQTPIAPSEQRRGRSREAVEQRRRAERAPSTSEIRAIEREFDGDR